MAASTEAQNEIRFATDEQLAARLDQLFDELIHIGYRLPSLAREVREIRRIIKQPSGDDDQVRLDASEVNQPPDPALAEPGALKLGVETGLRPR